MREDCYIFLGDDFFEFRFTAVGIAPTHTYSGDSVDIVVIVHRVYVFVWRWVLHCEIVFYVFVVVAGRVAEAV